MLGLQNRFLQEESSLKLGIKSVQISLGVLLQRFTEAKKDGVLAEFIIGKMTLENVFLDIVKEGKSKNALPPSLKIVTLAPMAPIVATVSISSPDAISPGIVTASPLNQASTMRTA